jgi:hypothetical protein
MPTLTDKQLHDLARLGAIARLKAITDEAATLRRTFPGLGKAQEVAPESAAPAATTTTRKRRRKKMSPEARKAVGVRMKAHWAKKRAEKIVTEPAPEAAEEVQAPKATAKKVAKKTPKPKAAKRAKKQA